MSVTLISSEATQEAPNFLLPNATFFFELFAFFLVLYILKRFVVPPVSKAMTARQETIRKQLEDGRESRARAEAAEAEYKQALVDSKADAARIRDEARAEGQSIIEELRQRAQEEADRIAVREHGRLEAERKQIVTQMRTEVGEIAVLLAGKIVGESLDDEARQRRMVERFIAELESGQEGSRASGGEPVVAG